MHHRRHHKVKCVFSGGESISFLYCDRSALQVKIEELADHRESLCVSDDLNFRVAENEIFDHGAVVRLHMVYNEVIQCAAVQYSLDIFKELASYRVVRSVKEHRLFVHQKVGVVGNSVREREDVLE